MNDIATLCKIIEAEKTLQKLDTSDIWYQIYIEMIAELKARLEP